jgi:predicted GIY-YIG superfamily endonuclease
MEKQRYVYVLKCRNEKYYVGLTENPSFRIEHHFAGEGSEWTRKHEPIEVVSVTPRCEQENEKIVIFRYMKKYGMDNVRGSVLSTLDLPDTLVGALQQLNIRDMNLPQKLLENKKNVPCVPAVQIKQQDLCVDVCYRCGREGHLFSSCYAKTHVNGKTLLKTSPLVKSSANDGLPPVPPIVSTSTGTTKGTEMKPLDRPTVASGAFCLACGLSGHSSSSCCAVGTTPEGKQKSVYILKCKNEKYYVGLTENPSVRIEHHFLEPSGSEWTRKHAPVEVVSIIPGCDLEDERVFTLQYMKKYGMDNVRGGPFVTLDLPDTFSEMIKQLVVHAKDVCYRCGLKGHYGNVCKSSSCYVDKTENFSSINLLSLYGIKDQEHKLLDYLINSGKKEKNIPRVPTAVQDMQDSSLDICLRCGRDGHLFSSCYAKTHVEGRTLSRTSLTVKISRKDGPPPVHPVISASKANEVNQSARPVSGSVDNDRRISRSIISSSIDDPKGKSNSKNAESGKINSEKAGSTQPILSGPPSNNNSGKTTGFCFRCGHFGHFAEECYAARHKNGYFLNSSSKGSR